MCSESLPKEFEKTSEVLPIKKYGISSYQEFKAIEEDLKQLEWLKKIGLTNEEIDLYNKKESGQLDCKNIESGILREKLDRIYSKINTHKDEGESSIQRSPSSSTEKAEIIFKNTNQRSLKFYPEGHPMNDIKKIDEALFAHLRSNDILPITKRKKILRRLERKKQRLLSQQRELVTTLNDIPKVPRAGSLWDVKEIPARIPRHTEPEEPLIGPKKHTLYTVKDNKIVRLEPLPTNERASKDLQSEMNNSPNVNLSNDRNQLQISEDRCSQSQSRIEEKNKSNNERIEYRAVDIVVPTNSAEEQLLEGTKMTIDNIKKIERFKDYEPGIPSKVLYLKNISPGVSQEQLSVLFNQFVLENGGPIDVRLMSGRMRGQAFISFHDEEVAIRALDEVNGTIMSGRPIIAHFGRNSQRIQDDHR